MSPSLRSGKPRKKQLRRNTLQRDIDQSPFNLQTGSSGGKNWQAFCRKFLGYTLQIHRKKNPLGSYFGVSTRLERRGNVRHGEGARLKLCPECLVGCFSKQPAHRHKHTRTHTHTLPWFPKDTAQRLAKNNHPSEASASFDFVLSWQIHFLNHRPPKPFASLPTGP